MAAAALFDRLGRMAGFIWSAWAGVAAIALLAALWQMGHDAWGDFILPSPLATFWAAVDILQKPASWQIVWQTCRRALAGFVLAALIGSTIGLAAGYAPAVLRLARPLLTVVLGVPPIAWIVLALIWFGSTDGTVMTTVIISAAPLVFAGVAEGVVTRDRGLDDMARAFGAGPWLRFKTLALRHVTTHLFTALTIALGTAFKVAVMAELLSNVGGIGGGLAAARANIDIAGALAWVFIAVTALILVEYGVLHPLRSELERWRAAAQPWGVKR